MVKEVKYYCDRCEQEIKEYNPRKNLLSFLFTEKDYIIEWRYIPKNKVKAELQFCQDCFISWKKWFNREK